MYKAPVTILGTTIFELDASTSSVLQFLVRDCSVL